MLLDILKDYGTALFNAYSKGQTFEASKYFRLEKEETKSYDLSTEIQELQSEVVS